MTISKLHIQRVTLFKGDWVAITFTGPNEPYSQLCKDLSKERHFNAYWEPRFGWIISSALLPKYADRFDNLQAKLDEADSRIER